MNNISFFHNIKTIARYEATILRRSLFFRLFSIGALLIFTFLNLGLFSPIGDESWELVAIPSSVPLLNLYLLNIAQSVLVIFLAADFLRRDKKIDTNEVLYTRPMSNLEYVTGKTWGILKLFLGLDIIILLIALIINVISKSMTVDLLSYVTYLIIICVPTLLFSLGLSFLLMLILRNQALTFLILLGIAALNLFWLYYRFGSFFDYMAFGLPVFKSGVIGFDNPELIINQRLMYGLLGISLACASVLLFNRPPQSKIHTGVSIALMIFTFAGSFICGLNTVSLYKTALHDRKMVIEAAREFEHSETLSLTSASIDLLHAGETIQATATLSLTNNNNDSIDKYFFSLNPGLKINSIVRNNTELKYRTVNHITEVEAQKPLYHGQTDSITISYSGTINEAFCYPDYSGSINDNPYSIEFLNVNKRQAFLTERYVLLTPETHWYPVPGLNYYPSNPARIKVDFTSFHLRVNTSEGLRAVSQGLMKKEGDCFCYSPESPLTGLTLAIGNYCSDTLEVDSINYIIHYFEGNDYYKNDLSGLKDTMSYLVSGIMRELEATFSTTYPFKTLSFLEVPVQFYSYPRMSTQTRAELQPSMVLLPEKLVTMRNAGFRKQMIRQKKRMARNNQIITDKDLQVRLFNDFIRNSFISGENFRYIDGVAINEPVRYRLSPSFYFFRNNFYSFKYPVINAVFESHLQKVTPPSQTTGYYGSTPGLSDYDKANLVLSNYSLNEILSKNPSSDTIRKILTLKGDYLFNLLRAKAGIDEFNTWFKKYIDNNQFRSVSADQFNKDIKNNFGFEFYPFLDEWFNAKEQAAFNITSLQVSQIIIDNRQRYQVTFTASNPEPVAGLFTVSFRTGPVGGRSGLRGGAPLLMAAEGGSNNSNDGGSNIPDASNISKIVVLGPGEARKVGLTLDAEPRVMMVNTLVSKNIPGLIVWNINNINNSPAGTKPFEGEILLESIPDYSNPLEIIVDNEDPGFIVNEKTDNSPLKRILGISNENSFSYQQINQRYAPEHWQPVVQPDYYGKYILSAVYTRSGNNTQEASWNAVIREPGYYNIYFYVGKAIEQDIRRDRTGGPAGESQGRPTRPVSTGGDVSPADQSVKDIHLKIYHNEGIEELTFDYQNARGGWNNLGRYYLSSDTARVVITNMSEGKYVIADAVRWVKDF
ncbi:MAG: hypothetical protein GXY51_05700 [Bacteroidetes bacterium]|jgi:hypothetical protein|nr:hypothetical protein [Bacteroidota bacterium]